MFYVYIDKDVEINSFDVLKKIGTKFEMPFWHPNRFVALSDESHKFHNAVIFRLVDMKDTSLRVPQTVEVRSDVVDGSKNLKKGHLIFHFLVIAFLDETFR